MQEIQLSSEIKFYFILQKVIYLINFFALITAIIHENYRFYCNRNGGIRYGIESWTWQILPLNMNLIIC